MKAVIILFVMLALLWYCVPDFFFSPAGNSEKCLQIEV
jgi:hypothetical protein